MFSFNPCLRFSFEYENGRGKKKENDYLKNLSELTSFDQDFLIERVEYYKNLWRFVMVQEKFIKVKGEEKFMNLFVKG